MYAFAAQLLDAATEWGAGGKGGVYEGEDDDGHTEGGGLGEDAEGVGIAYALGPLIDRVVGGRATMIA